MTAEQLATLNALVTFAAENVPGGLSEDEQEVARIVGCWALSGVEDPIEVDIPCTCAEDRQGGDPEDHSGTCPWAIVHIHKR